jgi:ubiquinone/menaquinone biosynthesis C-methylase UbiE
MEDFDSDPASLDGDPIRGTVTVTMKCTFSFSARSLVWLLPLLAVSCAPTMTDYQGHKVFNPIYLFYLESPDRDEWQKPGQVLEALQVGPGLVVADIGAGGGYFTEKLSRRVGSTGHVYATDVQDVMIRELWQRVATQSLTNVTVIKGDFDDPRLPDHSCDLIFFSSVYKEISDRPLFLKRMRPALKPGGRVAIIEYRPDADAPGPPEEYRLPQQQVIAELEAAGFRLVAQFDFLPREYFLVFALPSVSASTP